ncbi:coiled-coil domain-containing protein 124 [Trichonephila clavipes]|nr:coiled-coil domain-containing protein 124 [Trichonephila clavipes]
MYAKVETSKHEKELVHDEKPLEENINRLQVEGDVARNVEDAIAILSIGEEKVDLHPEKRVKAAYLAFEEKNLPILKAENPNLRLSQQEQIRSEAVGSLVVRASDSRPEGLGSMPDATKHPQSTHGVSRCRNCGGGDRGRVAIYRPFGELRRAKIVLSPVAQGQRQAYSSPCHDEFRGPRSDCVRQVASENNNNNK